MQYYYVNDENELCEIQSEKKMKDSRFQEDPADAIDYILNIQKHCLSNEEYAVKIRKEKVNKLQQMFSKCMNNELKINAIE